MSNSRTQICTLRSSCTFVSDGIVLADIGFLIFIFPSQDFCHSTYLARLLELQVSSRLLAPLFDFRCLILPQHFHIGLRIFKDCMLFYPAISILHWLFCRIDRYRYSLVKSFHKSELLEGFHIPIFSPICLSSFDKPGWVCNHHRVSRLEAHLLISSLCMSYSEHPRSRRQIAECILRRYSSDCPL